MKTLEKSKERTKVNRKDDGFVEWTYRNEAYCFRMDDVLVEMSLSNGLCFFEYVRIVRRWQTFGKGDQSSTYKTYQRRAYKHVSKSILSSCPTTSS